MKAINNDNFNPFYNLALEEYLLKKNDSSEDFFFLWRNQKCVVIGRNQNPFNEINIEYALKNNIDIVRRSSGGGTVYHDEGNINFTFITTKISERLHNYEYFLSPIISLLKKLNIEARFVPKTHIYVGDNKVSGNAQTYFKNKMIHHGTLLFDVDSNHLHNVLKNKTIIDTYAISSERSKVLNLKDVVSVEITITQLIKYIYKEMGIKKDDFIELSKEQQNDIHTLAETKYNTWDWVFGQTPKFTIDKGDYHFEITNCLITNSSHLKNYLVGEKFDRQIISRVLKEHPNKIKIIELLFT